MSVGITTRNPEPCDILRWESEGGELAMPASPLRELYRTDLSASISPGSFSKLRNDDGIAEIRIGMKEFECMGASPPHDHPHVYLNMGLSDSMLCPYCATAFRFDSALAPNGVRPIGCLYKWS